MLTLFAAGRLGRDAFLKDVNGSPVAEFALAMNTGEDQTTWLDVSIWGKRGEDLAQSLTKGATNRLEPSDVSSEPIVLKNST